MRSRTSRVYAALALLLTAVTAGLATWLITADEPPPPVWVGDFETGTLDGWRTQVPAADRVKVVSSPTRGGDFAARFTLAGDDRVFDRLELSQLVRSTDEAAGQEWWWAWSTRIPADFQAQQGFCLFAEWHQTGLPDVPQGPPPIAFTCTDGEFSLIVRGGNEPNLDNQSFSLPDLADGEWHDFLFHVRWSPDPDGLVALWIDGEEIVPETRLRTSYRNQGLYLKIGPYRAVKNSSKLVLYHDEWRQGAERGSVD